MIGIRTGSRAAVFAALLVCAATGRAPAQGADTTPTGTLPGGLTYELRPDPAQSAAAVALWYRAPSSGFGPSPLPGLSRLAAATVAGSNPITGTALSTLVDRYGGRLSVSAYPDSVAITALVPPDRVAQTVRAMTVDYFAPVVTAEGLKIAQRDSGEDAVYRSLGPDAIEDALGAALFADGPVHDGTIGSAQQLGEAKLDQVRAFAERAFRPSNAILVLTGNVDRTALAAVVQRAGARASDSEAAAAQTPRTDGAPLQREGNLAGTGLGWLGPPIADEAAATSLDFVADALFAPKTGVVSKAIRGRKASVTGKFVTYRSPGLFMVTISGEEADAVRPIVESAIASAAKPMPRPAFEAARQGFVYRLLSDMETPSALADTFGWYAIEGNPAYAPAEGGLQGRYFRIATALTPSGVAQTVAKYLGGSPAVVTLTKVSGKRPT